MVLNNLRAILLYSVTRERVNRSLCNFQYLFIVLWSRSVSILNMISFKMAAREGLQGPHIVWGCRGKGKGKQGMQLGSCGGGVCKSQGMQICIVKKLVNI